MENDTFGFFLIWGDEVGCLFNPGLTTECCGDDNMADTPYMSCSYSQYNTCASHSTCANLPNSYGSTDMYINFMAFANDPVHYMLTSGQADRMYYVATNNGYATILPTKLQCDCCSLSTKLCTFWTIHSTFRCSKNTKQTGPLLPRK